MARRVALLSIEKLPISYRRNPGDESYGFPEDVLLSEEFRRRGWSAERVVWSDPGVRWDRFDLVLIRSAWDYVWRLEEFLSVLERVEADAGALWNPGSLVRWNCRKRYLVDLQEKGVAVVPTRVCDRPSSPEARRFVETECPGPVVIKPAVGAGSVGVQVASREDFLAGRAAAGDAADPDAGWLIQPFLPGLREEGEWSLVFLGGDFSHAVLKRPAEEAFHFRPQDVRGATPPPDALAGARQALGALETPPLYARVDLVRGHDGGLKLMELELIEPFLFLDRESAGRLVEAAERRLAD